MRHVVRARESLGLISERIEDRLETKCSRCCACRSSLKANVRAIPCTRFGPPPAGLGPVDAARAQGERGLARVLEDDVVRAAREEVLAVVVDLRRAAASKPIVSALNGNS